jgi:hypothetical protein
MKVQSTPGLMLAQCMAISPLSVSNLIKYNDILFSVKRDFSFLGKRAGIMSSQQPAVSSQQLVVGSQEQRAGVPPAAQLDA